MHTINFKCDNCGEHVRIQGTTRKICPYCGNVTNNVKEVNPKLVLPLNNKEKAKGRFLKFIGDLVSF